MSPNAGAQLQQWHGWQDRSGTVSATHAPGQGCLGYCGTYCRGPELGQSPGHVYQTLQYSQEAEFPYINSTAMCRNQQAVMTRQDNYHPL